jgi:hypothetical protein
MDPKMDSGFRQPGEPPDHYDNTRVLQPREIIWLFHQLLGCLASWHRGFLLTQGILTCHYIDNLLRSDGKALADIVLKFPGRQPLPDSRHWSFRVIELFCISLIKSIGIAIGTIQRSRASIWEEEDISTQTYGLSLFSRVPWIELHQAYATELKFLRLQLALDEDEELMIIRDYLKVGSFLVSGMSLGTQERCGYFNVAFEWFKRIGDHPAARNTMPVPEAFSTKLQQRYATSTPMRGAAGLDLQMATKTMMQLCEAAVEGSEILKRYGGLDGGDQMAVSVTFHKYRICFTIFLFAN